MSERGKEKARVCKCLLKLNSNVCVLVLKYFKELLPVHPPTQIILRGEL